MTDSAAENSRCDYCTVSEPHNRLLLFECLPAYLNVCFEANMKSAVNFEQFVVVAKSEN